LQIGLKQPEPNPQNPFSRERHNAKNPSAKTLPL